jgi:hypothetical protein
MMRSRWFCFGVVILLAASVPVRASKTGGGRDLGNATELMVQIEESLSGACDPALLESRIDFDDLVGRGIDSLEAPEAIKRQFTDGVRRGFDLARAICGDIETGGSYSLLDTRMVEGQPRALFRLLGDDGVNYHDYLLGGDPVQVVDIYVYTNGEWLSELVHRGFLSVAARFGTRSSSADGADRLYLANLDGILRMIELYRNGDFEGSLAIFEALPGELKTHRTILMQRFAAAVPVGGEAYQQAMQDLKDAFPDDGRLGLVFIDYYFALGEYDESLELIRRLDKQIGGDPYLDFLRANVLYAAGRPNAAKRAARKAIEGEPWLEDAYWVLVSISLEQREFEATVRLLAAIESELGLALDDLNGIPEYSEFVASEAYSDWMAMRPEPE